jgi:dienelactone hydrolase
MVYDPRARGPHPVGVHTTEVARDDRRLTVELWYPASERYAGADRDPGTRDAFAPYPGAATTWQAAVRDAAPRLGAFPLVIFCHELGGHRRQSTFLCTHLASHGYVVAAADHAGSETGEVLALARCLQAGELLEPVPVLAASAAARPGDLRAIIDALFCGAARTVTRSLQRERVAAIGHGIGAAAALAAAAGDPRILAAVALAPPSRETPEAGHLAAAFEDGFGRVLPILTLAAERDSVAPLSGVREFVGQLRAPARLAVIKNADHYHVCDQAERVHGLLADLPLPYVAGGAEGLTPYGELIAAERAYGAIRSLGLAHLDAFIKTREGAKEALAHALARRAPGAEDEAVDVELG